MSSVESVTPTAVVRRIFERLNDRDADAMSLFWSDDVAEVWPVVGRLDGKGAVRDYFVAIFAAMPDFHIDVERMAAADETVFVHWHMTGTFTGAPLLGIDATGRSIDLRGTDCFTIRDEKIAAAFIAYDGMAFPIQAGLLPPHGSRMDHAMTVAVNWMTRARKRLGRDRYSRARAS